MTNVMNALLSVVSGLVNAIGGPSMLKFLVRRTLAAMPVVFTIMFLTFTLTRLMPGGPFDFVGQKAMPEHVRAQLEERYGLTKSLVIDTPTDAHGAEVTWGKHAFVKGGFGETVTDEYAELGDTGFQFRGSYDLYRWDETAQRLVEYETYPYRNWVRDNSELVYTANTLSVLASTASGIPGAASTIGQYISSTATVNSSVDEPARC